MSEHLKRIEAILRKQGIYPDEYDLQEVEGYRPTGQLGE